MSKEVVFITGIGGSGASYLVEYILNNHPDVEIHGNTRWHSGTTQKNLEIVKNKITIHESDLLDLPSVIRILRKIKPTKIFNLASHANVRVCFDTPIAVLQNNVLLMINLLEAIRLECPDTILQQCSTSEVYGTPKTIPIYEDHPITPINPYAVSKDTQEKLCYAYNKAWKLKVVITRAFAYINPRRRGLFATDFANQIAEIEIGKKDILYHGNLDSVRTLMDVRDMVRAYWMASEKCEYANPYNIGDANPISVGEFLDKLCTYSKVKIKCEKNSGLLRPIDMTNQVCNTNQFDTLTGFKPKYTLNESIEWLLGEVRKNV